MVEHCDGEHAAPHCDDAQCWHDPGTPDTRAFPGAVDHPAHYGGADNPYEAIKVIEAWDLGFNLGNAVKYISRAGKKDPAKLVEDLQKAAFYLNREIERAR